jgi:hypothetical protein
MPVTTTNLLTLDFHGTLGGQVILRSYRGRTVMSNVHDYRNAVWSPAQKLNRLDVSKAIRRAIYALKDPKTYRYYKKRCKGLQTPYNVAIGEFMRQIKQESAARQQFIPAGKVIPLGIDHSYTGPSVMPGFMESGIGVTGSVSQGRREIPVATGFQ